MKSKFLAQVTVLLAYRVGHLCPGLAGDNGIPRQTPLAQLTVLLAV